MKICPINAWAANGLFNLNRLGIYAVVYWDRYTADKGLSVFVYLTQILNNIPRPWNVYVCETIKGHSPSFQWEKRSFSLVLKYADLAIAWLYEINVTNITVNSNYWCLNDALHQFFISGYIFPVYYFDIRWLQRGGGVKHLSWRSILQLGIWESMNPL